MNIEFLLAAYFISLSVDWILQGQWHATNKSKWSYTDDKVISTLALVTHSITYAFTTYILLNALGIIHGDVYVFITLLITHAIIDTRIPVKWILKLKGMTKEQINDPHMAFMHIGIDHRLHELILLILSFFVR